MKKSLLVLLCAGLLAGCGAGSGEGLNPQGLPQNGTGNDNGDDDLPAGVTLAQLQENIFGAICTQCHVGSGAPQGLRLDSEQNSYDLLVNQPSGQQPGVLRVAPGEPGQSYLVRKLEGDSSISGSQMPLGQTPLSSDQIAAVRNWIANGAPREGTGDTPTTMTMERLSSGDASHKFQLRFSRPVATATLDFGVQVYLHNGDHRWLMDSDSYTMTMEEDNQRLTLTLSEPDIPVTGIEFIVNDPAAGTLLDTNNRVLDGDRDRREGGVSRYEYPL